jgi:hypothetical protein
MESSNVSLLKGANKGVPRNDNEEAAGGIEPPYGAVQWQKCGSQRFACVQTSCSECVRVRNDSAGFMAHAPSQRHGWGKRELLEEGLLQFRNPRVERARSPCSTSLFLTYLETWNKRRSRAAGGWRSEPLTAAPRLRP